MFLLRCFCYWYCDLQDLHCLTHTLPARRSSDRRRGFAGIYCPSGFGGMALCEALAFATKTIPFGTAIAPIYTRPAEDYAQTVAFTHEVSDGRFRSGLRLSIPPHLARLGPQAGQPLAHPPASVARMRKAARMGQRSPGLLAPMGAQSFCHDGALGRALVFPIGPP